MKIVEFLQENNVFKGFRIRCVNKIRCIDWISKKSSFLLILLQRQNDGSKVSRMHPKATDKGAAQHLKGSRGSETFGWF